MSAGIQFAQRMYENPPSVMTAEQQIRELEAMGAANVLPPLPVSPALKHKRTGRIYAWMQCLADRPEDYVNCDEHGNEAPAAWQGRNPPGWGEMNRPPEATGLAELQRLHRAGVTPDMESLSAFGVPIDFVGNYATDGGQQPALPLSAFSGMGDILDSIQAAVNVSVR